MRHTNGTHREFTLTWTLDASPADVFQAWTDPEQLDWFYNDAQPIPAEPIELDLRVGGVWRQRMVIDERTAYFTGGVYREIVPDEKLVFAWGATDGWPDLDLHDLDESPQVTVTFDRDGDRTAMTVHVEVPAQSRADVHQWWSHARDGWRDTVDRLVTAVAAGIATST
jgi:uncharacterized protein YndB with AHSA1/START domain